MFCGYCGKMIAVVLLIGLLVACSAPAAPAKPATPSATTVVEAFRVAGLPVADVQEFTAADDPNTLLGRPGQYVQKVKWATGTIEVFTSQDDLRRRKAYVDEIAKTPLFAEYSYAKGLVLLRLDKALTPDQAASYDRVLQGLPL